MHFKDIQLINGGKHSEEKLSQNRYLTKYWENVRNLFSIHLVDGLDVAGISKLNIQLGEYEGPEYSPPDHRGIAVFKRKDFDFHEFSALEEEEKDAASLEYIESSLLTVCSESGVSAKVSKQLKQACQAIREEGYEHIKLHKKTSKWHSSRKARAETKLHFRRGGIDAYLEFIDKHGNVLGKHKIADSRFWDGLWADLWKGRWENDTFLITNRFGDTFVRIESAVDGAF
ncbi:hypothetical protein GCM10007414_38110 [Agarivorans gilvus]|uniref:Uncharacterized protein n=2 Tax=Agarivorans gilvus TaxID=680279 RepID=A0ABQ1I7K8_9ALTE|nr:hypothetical protein GCM10007414_38110 [Agarivorans gilvus]